MAHFEDLRPCTYGFPGETSRLLSIGWLANGHPFPTGQVNDAFVRRLRELLKSPWGPVDFMGVHACDLCPRHKAATGAANLFVPALAAVFVAPELILHYVTQHTYRPPDEFITAVTNCPPMKSEDYMAAMALQYQPFQSAP